MLKLAQRLSRRAFQHGREMVRLWQNMERTTANSSMVSPMFGNQSDTGMPDLPYCLKVRSIGITGRFIGALLSPNPMASMIFPECLLSLGSNVSMWLMPPHRKMKITDFAGAGPGRRASGICPSSAQREPSAAPMKPAADW